MAVIMHKWRVNLVTRRPSEARADIRSFKVSAFNVESAVINAVLQAQRAGLLVSGSFMNRAHRLDDEGFEVCEPT